MKKIFMVDAYDSFVYMIYQYLGELTEGKAEIRMRRTSEVTLNEIRKFSPDYIILSPGPGHPKDSKFLPVIEEFHDTPTLGVCLGHQAIGLAFGAKVTQARKILHGKTSQIEHDKKTIFHGLKSPIEATRYHSLMVVELPDSLEKSAVAKDDREIMALRHKKFPMEGVQFHPESVLTEEGKHILRNFLSYYG